MATPIHSFDVFDTVLTRVHAEAGDVQRDWAEQAVSRGWAPDAQALLRARHEAETAAWREAGWARAIHLDDIHRHLAQAQRWNEAQRSEAAALELQIEEATVRPVPERVAEIAALRRRGRRIAFISDMHLPASAVRRMLERWGIAEPGDVVLVSSEAGCTKRSGGRLFAQAAAACGAPRRALRHCGDDPRADSLMAWRQGVPARRVDTARLSAHEQAFIAALPATAWRERSAAAAMRMARLHAGPGALGALLAGTVAPFVAGYALWLLQQAQRHGLQSLFFLARDMQIVREVAQCFVQARGLALHCGYLHASRAAWQPAAYRGDPQFDAFWLADQAGRNGGVKAALARVLDAAALERLAQQGLLAAEGAASPEALAQAMRQPVVAYALQDAADTHRRRLLNYLQAQGFAPDGRHALVDAGWRGTLQKCLARAYAAAGHEAAALPGFYIGLRHAAAPEPGSTLQAWLPAEVVEASGYALVALVEGFLTADHGTTLGYDDDETGAAPCPRLGAAPAPAIAAQWQQVRQACLAFAHELVASPAWHGDADRLAPALATPLLQLCRQPRRADALLLRGWLFDAGRGDVRLKALAPGLSAKDMAKLLAARWRGHAEADIYLSGPWLRGSVAAAKLPLRWMAASLLPPRQAT